MTEKLVSAPGDDPSLPRSGPVHRRDVDRRSSCCWRQKAGVRGFPAWCSASWQERCQGTIVPGSAHRALLFHLVSPPPLIQLQYCINNFLQLPREEQTSEARRALPSPPRSQWAAGTKAGRRFAKSLILSNSYSQGCIKSSSHKKPNQLLVSSNPFKIPWQLEQGLDEAVSSSQTQKCRSASADGSRCCQASGGVDHSPLPLCTQLASPPSYYPDHMLLPLLVPSRIVVPLALIQAGAFMGC